MVPKWGSGRLVRQKSGQEAILDRYADRYADPCGRFWRPLGVMLGLMLGLCWHLFSWWFFDAVRTSFWTPTWSEIEAKIEPKTFPKTSKFRTWKSEAKSFENKLSFHGKSSMLEMILIDFWMRGISRVCFRWHERMSQKHTPTIGFGTIFEHRPFCLNMRLSSEFDRRWSWNRTCL